MKILVVGAGATGGYFGSRLQQAGHEVTFLVRAARAEQLTEHGLVINGPQEQFTVTPRCLTAEQLEGETWPLIIVAVKHQHLAEVIRTLPPAVGASSLIVPLLNGMQHIALLQQAFGQSVVGGLCQIYARLSQYGEIEQLSPLHRLSFGALHPSQCATVKEVGMRLQNVGFSLTTSADITSEMWEKYLFLGTLGASTCLAGADTRAIIASQGGAAYIDCLFTEILAVITAAGYQPRSAVVSQLRSTLLNPNTPLVSSLYRDVTAGKPSESQPIIGDLVRHADTHHLPASLLRASWVRLQLATDYSGNG